MFDGIRGLRSSILLLVFLFLSGTSGCERARHNRFSCTCVSHLEPNIMRLPNHSKHIVIVRTLALHEQRLILARKAFYLLRMILTINSVYLNALTDCMVCWRQFVQCDVETECFLMLLR